jgi:type 2 lantibiotic biosynthesis protein LanM
MDRSYFQDASWFHAATMTERIASLRAAPYKLPNKEDAKKAERRLQRWRSQSPFTAHSRFAQRLAMAGIREDEFREVLGEPIEAVRDRFAAPGWLSEFAEAFYRAPESPSVPLPPELRDNDMAGFLDAIAPLIGQARGRLHKGVESLTRQHTFVPFDLDSVEELLYTNLPRQLLRMVSRTLALELNVARLQGILKGDTPEERFKTFNSRLCRRETAIALFAEYPVLARQLTVAINNWIHSSLEFLDHLCADYEAIRTAFSPEKQPGLLVALDGGAGDSHRGGKSVMIAKFDSGFQVVYKPKSLAVDVHFQELLAWLNERSGHPPFYLLKVLDRGNYGWVEYIGRKGCTSIEELQRFYERQGGYLALLYAIEAVDFHFENLIAFGEHPVLLDLEALFHPRLHGTQFEHAGARASLMLNESVLRVGLLPQRKWATGGSEGIDFSGLGAAAGQTTPYKVAQWEGVGTDEMHVIRKPAEMRGGHNRPTLNGDSIDVLDYTESIVSGFTGVYTTLLKHRDEALNDGGPLARFAADEVRVIVRPTRTYALLLTEGFHPDVLRDALERDRLFDRLWSGIEHSPHLARLIHAECEDLWRNDIPMFTTLAGSPDLWSSSGEQLAGFFDESGLALARRRVRQLNDEDLSRQIWFIRASLTTLAANPERSARPRTEPPEPQTVADRGRLLAAARAAGDRLGTLALQGDEDASWIGLRLTAKNHWSLEPLGLDLYNGLPGVALFLAYLGAITGETRYSGLARAAMRTVRRQVGDNPSQLASIGGFDGWGGVIYTLTHLASLWNQPELLAEAEDLADRIDPLIDGDEVLDVIGGSAGCIAALISLHQCRPSERTLGMAIRCGDRLIATAQRMQQGIGWMPRFPASGPLTGFSHGAAGMAWALLEVAALTGEDRFRSAALAAMEYERYQFSAEAENWPDLREFDESSRATTPDQREKRFATAWCHGAAGIGLARLRSQQHLDATEIRAEIAAAIGTTLKQGFGGNHSLCHGDLGNLETILQAARFGADPDCGARVGRLAATILESIDKDGWLCGLPLSVESPGLMTGLAGIGYQLLRLAEPAQVPAVLVLEPPPQRPKPSCGLGGFL